MENVDEYIATELSILENKINALSSINKNNESINLENFMLGIFNIIFSTNFVNMNEKNGNYPGIDLYSEDKKIAIQVTSNKKADKKRDCLNKVKDLVKNCDIIIDKLYIFVLTTSKSTVKLNETPYFSGKNILNINYIMGLGESLKKNICKYIENYYGRNFDSTYKRNEKLVCEVFVKTKVYESAKEKLKNNHAIILNGNAGTGKTITSYKLLFDYIEKGYLYITSTKDINNENFTKTKYILFNDDFISPTDVASADYNKIQNDIFSVELANENFKVILNSRTNILNTYSTENKRIDFNNYKNLFVSTENLSRLDKFNIIKNHIEKSYDKETLLQLFKKEFFTNKYMIYKIIDHKKFNPRIIEMFKKNNLSKSNNLVDEIIYALNNPDTIYNEQYKKLSDTEKQILIFIFVNGGLVSKHDLQVKFKNITTIDLNSYLINLTDSFLIQTQIKDDEFNYTFFNPSIEDFCEKIVKSIDNLDNELDSTTDKKVLLKLLGYENITLDKKLSVIKNHDQKLSILYDAQYCNRELFDKFNNELKSQFIIYSKIPYHYREILSKSEIYEIESQFDLSDADYIYNTGIHEVFQNVLKDNSVFLSHSEVINKIIDDYEEALNSYIIDQVDTLIHEEVESIETIEGVDEIYDDSMILVYKQEFEENISCEIAEIILTEDYFLLYDENESTFSYLRDYLLRQKHNFGNVCTLLKVISEYDFNLDYLDIKYYIFENLENREKSKDELKSKIEEFKLEVEMIE